MPSNYTINYNSQCIDFKLFDNLEISFSSRKSILWPAPDEEENKSLSLARGT